MQLNMCVLNSLNTCLPGNVAENDWLTALCSRLECLFSQFSYHKTPVDGVVVLLMCSADT